MSGEGRLPPPFRLIILDSVDSTNDEAKRQAAAGAGHGLVVTAALQTAGRGRRGRHWQSPRGNLHASFLLSAGPPADAAQLGFVASVALVEALSDVAPAGRFACKWPNDVLMGGRKVSGMLLETTGIGDLVVLGMGIDIGSSPAESLYPTACLAQAGCTLPPLAVLAAIAGRLAPWLERWLGEGFAPVRAGWLAHASGIGEDIEVRLDSETLSGRFAGLDEAGALLLDLAGGGCRRILAGDVFFPAG